MGVKEEKVLEILKKTYPSAQYYLKFLTPLELMVAAILSAQVRDEVVNKITKDLFKKYKSCKDYIHLKDEDIAGVTFYKNKAENIRRCCKILLEKYNGDVPKSMRELTSLPGIARKTANVILQNSYNIVEGIVVDTHVIRLSQRLGWTKQKNPEKIEQDLMKIFPKKEWKMLPHLLKNHGRLICLAKKAMCEKCVLNSLCSSAYKV